jgi:hypothetical protein
VGPVIAAVSSALPPDPAAGVPAGIRISPFSYRSLDETGGAEPETVARDLRDHLQSDYVLTDSGRQALGLILDQLGMGKSDVVTIVTTTGGTYVSRCVTETIEARCGWSFERRPETRAILVIHEWGRPCEAISGLIGQGLPVIEDCAYAFASRFADGSRTGSKGDFALFSLPKLFSVNFGGIAVSRSGALAGMIPEERRAYLLGQIGNELADLPGLLAARRANWESLRGLFAAEPFFSPGAGEEPAVFLFRHDPSRVPLDQVRTAFEARGVEASVFYGEDAFYVPCHHRLGLEALRFLAGIYQSLLEQPA